MKTRFATLATALTAIAISGATPAAAADRSVSVMIGDLDLSANSGRAVLDRRIGIAARMVCDTGARDGASLRAERECQAVAIAKASAKAKIVAADTPDARLASLSVDPDA